MRSIDGSMNNLQNPTWGKSFTNLLRTTPARYQDGKSVPIHNMPNPRYLSESIIKLKDNKVVPNSLNLTMLFGTFGQFLDHDITLTNEGEIEDVVIPVPRCDSFFDRNCTGNVTITYTRSEYDPSQPVRTNINQLTSWIDASMVYGSTMEVHKTLRSFQNGKLKTSPGDLLPLD